VKPVSTSYDGNTQLKKNKGEAVAQLEYAQIIESLMYLINFTQPDIAYVACRLSRYTYNPNHKHWVTVVRLMKYFERYHGCILYS